MICHIERRCRLYEGFDRVVVATCDQEIYDTIRAEGGEAVMTKDTHERCTDRVEEAIENLDLGLDDADMVLMVQGDEILVSPDMLRLMHQVYTETQAPVVNLVSRLTSNTDHDDPNTMKVVQAPDGRIIYFSRAAIPSRARSNDVPMYQQTGIIAFQTQALRHFSNLAQTPLEQVESCDMMRFVEHGFPVFGVRTETETIGIDTPADADRATDRLRNDPFTDQYLGGGSS